MIFFAKPVLTEDLHIVQKEKFSVTCYSYMCDVYIWLKAKHVLETNPYSRQKLLHKDYDRKGSAEETISGRESQGAWRHDELIGGNQPVVKQLWL
jgi:hypothetical protein